MNRDTSLYIKERRNMIYISLAHRIMNIPQKSKYLAYITKKYIQYRHYNRTVFYRAWPIFFANIMSIFIVINTCDFVTYQKHVFFLKIIVQGHRECVDYMRKYLKTKYQLI